jgi:formylglycine-generating enzyme required for sulfatase activity
MNDSDSSNLALMLKLTQARRRRRLSILGLAFAVVIVLLALTIEGLQLRVSPEEAAQTARVTRISGLAIPVAGRWFMLGKSVALAVDAEGFRPQEITVQRPVESRFIDIQMQAFPGELVITVSAPEPYELRVGGNLVEPQEPGRYLITAEAGELELALTGPRFVTVTQSVSVIGKGTTQHLDLTALAAEGTVRWSMSPGDAEVSIDGIVLTTFDGSVQLPLGDHEIVLSKAGYRPSRHVVQIGVGADIDLGVIELKPSAVGIQVLSDPAGAAVFVGGAFKGVTPVALALKSGESVALSVRLGGYQSASETVKAPVTGVMKRSFRLKPVRIAGHITSMPKAQILVNGLSIGSTPIDGEFRSGDQIRAVADGFADGMMTVGPAQGQAFEHHFELLRADQAPFVRAPAVAIVNAGIELKKFPQTDLPAAYLGSAGIAGRFANGVSVAPFYLGSTEITASQFAEVMNKPAPPPARANLPMTDISWEEAVNFCNALSAKQGLAPFYRFDDAKGVRVVYFDTESRGFRLPTELEWLVVNRPINASFSGQSAIYSWGSESVVPRGIGNLGGSEAAGINGGASMPGGYMDDDIELAKVGSYRANQAGIRDLDGNASEWLHDFKISHSTQDQDGPFGPAYGVGHLIRGSSFRTTSLAELSLAWRTHSNSGSDLVGFRVARSIR